MTRTVLLAAINETLVLYGNPPVVVLGDAYSFTFQALFGSGTYIFSESGSLPSGLSFADNGDGTATISGTASVPGNFPITIAVQDTNRNRISKNFTIVAQPLPLTISGHIAGGAAGAAASGSYSSSGGVGSKTFAVIAGTFPSSGGLSSAGDATGNWSAAGPYSWTVRVTDSATPTPSTADLADSCTIPYATLAYSSGALVDIYDVGDAGSTAGAITFTGGSGTLVGATVASGSLPPGCSASYSGMTWVMTGTATTYGSYTFVPRVQSSDGQFANAPSQTIIVGDPLWSSGVSLLHFDKPTVDFTGSISLTQLTVSAVASGTFAVEDLIIGSGITSNTRITSFSSGSGGTGVYNVNHSQTVASESMTAYHVAITDEHSITWTLYASSNVTGTTPDQSVFGGVSCAFNNRGYSTPRTPFNFGTGSWSIAMRIYPSDTGVDRDFFAHRNQNDNNNFWFIRRNSSNGLRFFARAGGSTICDVSTPNSVITGSAQNAIVVQRDSATGLIAIYVGGTKQTLSGTNFANNSVAMPYPSYDVWLGAGDDSQTGAWYGYIDEFNALTALRHTGSTYTVETRAFQNGGV